MIGLLEIILVAILVIAALVYIIRLLPIPAPFNNIAIAVVLLLGLLIVLGHSGIMGGLA